MKIPFRAALLTASLWATLSLPVAAREGHGPHVVHHGVIGSEHWRELPPDQRREILRARREFQKLSPRAQRQLWEEYQRRRQQAPHS